MSKPNMLAEILEAVHETFVDYPDVEVDCLLYLSSLRNNLSQVIELSDRAGEALDKMRRCSECGEPLQTYHYKESHTELDGCLMEDMVEVCCPNCDMPHQTQFK